MTSEETKTAPAAPAESEKASEKDTKEETKEEVKETKEPVKESPKVHKPDFEENVVYLYQFSRTPFLPSLSPYCLKVETWLRLAGLKYENVDHKIKFRSKKGQLPFIELNGEEIADSAIIVKELAAKFDKDLDKDLTNEQKTLSHAMISMIENHLFWVVIWWRSKHPENMLKGYKLNLQHAMGTKIPQGILNFLFKINFARKGSKKVKAQGIGVHKPDEILEFGKNDLKVLSELLSDKPFFFGDEPTSLDVVTFANLAQIYFMDKEVEYPLRDFMGESCPNLVGLVNRVKERCFPDWDEMCANLDLNSHLPKPPKVEEKPKQEEAVEEKKEEKEKDNKEKQEIEDVKDKEENEKNDDAESKEQK
ncbi:failed axon connections [Neocloeon triangulifer]|uniref:failed axon connections n=1 Tax=Neocloeon triangulifer TaxID=2078957 RepID=UPI00286F11C8|nr:failed axon connections [Neocloeon triangulifer]